MVRRPTDWQQQRKGHMLRKESGFVYLWALFTVMVTGILLAGTGQVWKVKSQREKEAELLYVGEQFRNAVMSYYNNTTGATKEYPKSLEDLLQDTRLPTTKRHLRKIYLDPMTNSTEWGLVEEAAPNTGTVASSAASARITGVHSLSEKKPIKKDKFPEYFAKFTEAKTYQDWQFVFKPGTASAQTAPASSQSKPGTGPAPASSPFSPQSSAPAGTSPFSSRPQAPGNTSPSSPTGTARSSSPSFSQDDDR